MNIFYPLGNGSQHNDLELRYSLRSLEKHLKMKYNKIFISGKLPSWIQNVEHIEFKDGKDKERNIFMKVYDYFIKNDENILFMNDDHLLVNDVYTVPNYYEGTIEEKLSRMKAGLKYKMAVRSCRDLLKNENALYFDVHTPIVYDARFKWLLETIPENIKVWPIVKSLYANTFQDGINAETKDIKIGRPYSVDEWEQNSFDKLYLSYGDRAIDKNFKTFLEKKYPKKSIFEK